VDLTSTFIHPVTYQTSQIIGADDEEIHSLIFLCNPYERICLFGNSKYPYWPSLVLQWFTSTYLFYQTIQQYRKYVLGQGIYFDAALFPFLHTTPDWGWHIVAWTFEAVWVGFLAGSVSIIGLISDVLQAPSSLRKWWAIAVNLNTYGFVFVTWVLILFIGYWMLFQENLTISSDITAAYYKIFMTTMISGGISLQLVSTIRYWYWDGYYIDLEEARLAEYEAANPDGGNSDTIFDDNSGSSVPASQNQPGRPSNRPNQGGSTVTPQPSSGGGVSFVVEEAAL